MGVTVKPGLDVPLVQSLRSMSELGYGGAQVVYTQDRKDLNF